jgi:hypothetical protein
VERNLSSKMLHFSRVRDACRLVERGRPKVLSGGNGAMGQTRSRELCACQCIDTSVNYTVAMKDGDLVMIIPKVYTTDQGVKGCTNNTPSTIDEKNVGTAPVPVQIRHLRFT